MKDEHKQYFHANLFKLLFDLAEIISPNRYTLLRPSLPLAFTSCLWVRLYRVCLVMPNRRSMSSVVTSSSGSMIVSSHTHWWPTRIMVSSTRRHCSGSTSCSRVRYWSMIHRNMSLNWLPIRCSWCMECNMAVPCLFGYLAGIRYCLFRIFCTFAARIHPACAEVRICCSTLLSRHHQA